MLAHSILVGLTQIGSLRYDYDARLKCLVIRLPSCVHEETTLVILQALWATLESQLLISPDMTWRASASQTTYPPLDSASDYEEWIADVTLEDWEDSDPLFFVKVAFTQTRSDAVTRITRRMQNN